MGGPVAHARRRRPRPGAACARSGDGHATWVHARDGAGRARFGLDAQLLVDIDLSILGSPAECFERYDQDVRKEYAWVPGMRYQEARAQVLQGFLDRPRLYLGEHAVALLEAQARINLAAALLRLAQ